MKDPRCNLRNQVHYPLTELLFMVISAVVSGTNDWDEIALFGKEKLHWLRKFFPYSNGTPCDTTLSRLFAKIDPDAFSQHFSEWIISLSDLTKGKVIAIDGKTMRGSYDKTNAKSALHIVSAFICEQELCMGQLITEEKSNEITAIPELLDLLTLEGAIITIDAMGCQRKIAKKIAKKEADYILQVKNNQKTLLEQIEKVFEITSIRDTHSCQDLDHDRIEQRRCEVITDLTHLDECEGWHGLKTLIRIKASRFHKSSGKTEQCTRYYISSRVDSAQAFNEYIRSHWAIENKLHWSLDVTFREDQSRKRVGNSAVNFGLITKIALTLVNNCELKKGVKKVSKKNKRLNAALSDSFREHLLQI